MAKRQLIKNSAVGVLQFILTAILTLVSVPLFIKKLGFELYGVFAIISVIGNLNLLTNFGLRGALLVYVAKQGKCKESDWDIIVTQILILAVMAVIITIVVIFRVNIVNDIFSIPNQYSLESIKLLLYMALANVLLILGQPFTAVLDALERIYLTNLSQFIYSIIYWGGLVAVVSMNGGLISVGRVVLVAAIVWFILVYLIYRKLWGRLTFAGLKSNFTRIAIKQFTYGSKIYLSGLVGFMFEPLSKIILSNFIGLNSVALFEIGTKIRMQISGLFNKGLYPLFPHVSKINNKSLLGKQLFDLSKKIHLIVLPVCILIGFTLPYLIMIWLGNGNIEHATVFTIVLTCSLLLLSPPIIPVYHFLAGNNMPEKNIWIQLSSVLVNAFVFFTLYKITGLFTILFANSLALLSSYLIGNYYQYKYLGANFKKEIKYFGKLLLFGIICISGCLLVRKFKPINAWDLVIYPILICIMFISFVRNFQLLTINDTERYLNLAPSLKKIIEYLLISKSSVSDSSLNNY
ncbi:MAG TPA: oligosaccharide flippase family protein [Bacteroidales bacterium]|nr:oligosaccharide flippase family protein [Bacteroidales bacterium]